jgi:hypothetical protein
MNDYHYFELGGDDHGTYKLCYRPDTSLSPYNWCLRFYPMGAALPYTFFLTLREKENGFIDWEAEHAPNYMYAAFLQLTKNIDFRQKIDDIVKRVNDIRLFV